MVVYAVDVDLVPRDQKWTGWTALYGSFIPCSPSIHCFQSTFCITVYNIWTVHSTDPENLHISSMQLSRALAFACCTQFFEPNKNVYPQK